MPQDDASTPSLRQDWKYRLGMGLFIYSLIPICTIELVALLPLDTAGIVTLGAVYVASGELAFLAAVALLGKPFIQAVKDKIKGFLFSKKPPARPTTNCRSWSFSTAGPSLPGRDRFPSMRASCACGR